MSIAAVKSSIADVLNGKSLWSGARISSPIRATRVSAAVDAGRQAYQSATSEPETHEY